MITGAITPYVFLLRTQAMRATTSIITKAESLNSLFVSLHENGIEVILDVVFNHTAEGNEMTVFLVQGH